MKKLFFALVACLCMSMTASAQYSRSSSSYDNSQGYPRFHAGIRAGMYSSVWNEPKNTEALVMPTAGFEFDFRIAPIPLYLETGLHYANIGTSVKHDSDLDVHSILMPLMLSYHFYLRDDMAIQPFAGMYGAYIVDSDSEYKYYIKNEIEYGGRLGVGFNWRRLYANIGYDFSIDNTGDWNNKDVKRGGAFISIGFNMGGDH